MIPHREPRQNEFPAAPFAKKISWEGEVIAQFNQLSHDIRVKADEVVMVISDTLDYITSCHTHKPTG